MTSWFWVFCVFATLWPAPWALMIEVFSAAIWFSSSLAVVMFPPIWLSAWPPSCESDVEMEPDWLRKEFRSLTAWDPLMVLDGLVATADRSENTWLSWFR